MNRIRQRPPVLLIHGLFSRPGLMRNWVDRFEGEGYECHTVTLPGRDPVDLERLHRTTLEDALAAVRSARDTLDRPPIVVGHSLGGLLGQQLAASADTAALVLLASVPPGVLWPQLPAIPHLLRLMPAILAGRAVLPSEATMRHVPLSTLDPTEQDEILPQLVPDSARVFRSLLQGDRSTRVHADAVHCPVLCVTAGSDRNVSARSSNQLARRYDAERQHHPAAPHWIIADSLIDEVAPGVLRWLDRCELGTGISARTASCDGGDRSNA